MTVTNPEPTKDSANLVITYDPNVKVGGQTLTNANRFQYSIGENNWKTATSTQAVSVYSNSKVYARYFDGINGYKTVSITIMNVDRVVPTITSATASTDWGATNSITITATDSGSTGCATGNIGIVGYGVNQSDTTEPTYTTCTATTSLNTTINNITANGTYYVWVKDKAGNTANKVVIVSKVDTAAPTTATLVSSNVEETTFTLTATGADGQSGIQKYEFYINGTFEETVTTTAGTATLNVTGKTGSTSYTCYVKVYDAAGNTKTSSSITVTTKSAVEPMDIALFNTTLANHSVSFRLDLNNREQSEIRNIKYYIKYSNDADSTYVLVDECLNFVPEFTNLPKVDGTDYTVKAEVIDIYGMTATAIASGSAFCFLEKTPVLTESGLKNIEDIEIGENVWTLNMDNNQRELKPVLNTIHSETNAIFELTVGEKIIKCTPRHQFYVQDKGWIRAYDLEEGDRLVAKDNSNCTIDKIKYISYGEETIPTYNLTVEGNHNYLITENEILVHNAASPSNYESLTDVIIK